MILIPDDPIIQNYERTGYPPKVRYRYWEFSDYEEEGDDEETEDPDDDDELSGAPQRL